MKTRGSYILYLLILCVVVGCKGTSSPSTASETDEYAGTCEGEKAKAILWVDYKRGRKITDGTPIRTVKVYADVHADGSLKVLSWCKKQPMKVENYLLKRGLYNVGCGITESSNVNRFSTCHHSPGKCTRQ